MYLKHFIYKILFYLTHLFSNFNKFINNVNTVNINNINIEEYLTQSSVYDDLLKGIINSEVREIRHKSYVIPEEAKKYKYIDGDRAEYVGLRGIKDKSLLIDDGLPIILIQRNKLVEESICESFSRVDKMDAVGQEYTIKINREYAPIFRLENYCNKIIVKELPNKKFLIELPTTIYPNKVSRKHNLFLNQLKKLFNDKTYNTEIIDFKTIEFITYNAYNEEDYKHYKFNNIKFENITIFNGEYVLSFICDMEISGESLIYDLLDVETELKYKMNAYKKNVKI